MYAIQQKKKERKVENNLEKEIIRLESLLGQNFEYRQNVAKIKSLREELEQFRQEKLETAANRLRLQVMQFGEKPS